MSNDALIGHSMDSPLSSLLQRAAVHCPPEATIGSVLETMDRLRIGSMVVTQPGDFPVGIVTLHDVLGRVVVPRRSLDAPVSTIMSTQLTTLPADAAAHEAALAMVRDGIRHVVVVRNRMLAGVISERDLFRLQRASLSGISAAIRAAGDLQSLEHVSREISQLAHDIFDQGITAANLMRIITGLNDLLTQRVIELEFAGKGLRDTGFCWLVMGSGGRHEQTFSTDQDNGIVFADSLSGGRQAAREILLPAALRVNQALDRCGFPLCKGEIMASNPKWCLSFSEWKDKFNRWIDQGDPESLLHGSIFFDFRPLYGETDLASQLRAWLAEHAAANPRFLRQMAENALRNRAPLGILRDFVKARGGDHSGTIDVKLNGTTLFVDAARIFSLASGVQPTDTSQRLRRAAHDLKIPIPEVEAWLRAFFEIQRVRLRHQHDLHTSARPMGNHLDPDQLNPLDRRILREAMRQARRVQRRLALDYQIG